MPGRPAAWSRQPGPTCSPARRGWRAEGRAHRPECGVSVLSPACGHRSRERPLFARLDRLAIHDGNRRSRVPAGCGAGQWVERTVQDGPEAGDAPAPEIAVHRRPGREIRRQLPPLAAGPEQVEDRVEHGAHVRRSWPASGLRRWNVGHEQRPLWIRQVRRLPPSPHARLVGIHADKSANRFQALEPVRQGVRRHFGAVGKDVVAGLMLRHDHGPNYMSDDFQSEIAFLGIEASPSFVRQPEGNGVAERFIRTLKENLLWVRHFETIEELRLALLEFAAWYNTHWLVARHGHRTPAQIRADQQPAMEQAA